MGILAELVRNLAAMLLLAAVLEMLIPPGPLARFVRLTLGLAVVALLILPLLELRGVAAEDLLPALSSEAAPADYAAQGQALGAELERQALADHSRRLAEQAAAMAELVDGVARAGCQVELDPAGQVTAMSLKLTAEAGTGPELAGETAAFLAGYYGLDEASVSCELVRLEEVSANE